MNYLKLFILISLACSCSLNRVARQAPNSGMPPMGSHTQDANMPPDNYLNAAVSTSSFNYFMLLLTLTVLAVFRC